MSRCYKAMNLIPALAVVVSCLIGAVVLQQECVNRADVVFVLDSSGSIDRPNFRHMLNFVSQLVDSMDVDGGQIRVGLVAYADDIQPAFNLSQYSSRQAIQDAISRIRYVRGTTNTDAAIRYVRTFMFTLPAGDRADVPNLVVLITDGASDNMLRTNSEAFLAKRSSIHFVVVGVGNFVNIGELVTLANYPYTVNYLPASQVSALSNLTQATLDLVCNNRDECSSSPCRGAPCVDSIELYLCQCPASSAGRICERRTTRQTDLVIAISGSTRVGVNNFLGLLNISRELVYGLNVDAGSHVAALTFADRPYIQFQLNTFSTQLDILNGLSMAYQGGSTDLAAAIRVIRTQMFTSSAGARPASQKVAVIMVEGRSLNETEAVMEAILARQAGISLLVVGVSATDMPLTEWIGVASYPTKINVFTVRDYDQLPTIVNRLITSVTNEVNECMSDPCQQGGTCVDLINGYECRCPDQFTGVNCNRNSSGKVDLALVLDTSGSTRNDRFFSIQNFVADLIELLEIGPNKTQVAALYFSNTTEELFQLDAYRTRQDLMYCVRKAVFSGGQTNVSGALVALSNSVFTVAKGDRLDAPNLAFIITDGNANVDIATTAANAAAVRQQYTYVIVLSVGLDPNVYGLWTLASAPSSKTVYMASSFRDLTGLLDTRFINSFVGGSPCASPQPCDNAGICRPYYQQYICQCTVDWTGTQCQQRCARSLDVAFVLDLSSGDFDLIYRVSLEFIRLVADGLPLRPDRVRLAFVTAVDTPAVQFYFNTYSSANPNDIRQALGVWPVTGRPCVPAALRSLRRTVFPNGGRVGTVPSVAILVTDANTPFDYTDWLTAADDVRAANIELYVVSVGSGPYPVAMAAVATDADHVINIPTVDNVTAASGRMLDRLCL